MRSAGYGGLLTALEAADVLRLRMVHLREARDDRVVVVGDAAMRSGDDRGGRRR